MRGERQGTKETEQQQETRCFIPGFMEMIIESISARDLGLPIVTSDADIGRLFELSKGTISGYRYRGFPKKFLYHVEQVTRINRDLFLKFEISGDALGEHFDEITGDFIPNDAIKYVAITEFRQLVRDPIYWLDSEKDSLDHWETLIRGAKASHESPPFHLKIKPYDGSRMGGYLGKPLKENSIITANTKDTYELEIKGPLGWNFFLIDSNVNPYTSRTWRVISPPLKIGGTGLYQDSLHFRAPLGDYVMSAVLLRNLDSFSEAGRLSEGDPCPPVLLRKIGEWLQTKPKDGCLLALNVRVVGRD